MRGVDDLHFSISQSSTEEAGNVAEKSRQAVAAVAPQQRSGPVGQRLQGWAQAQHVINGHHFQGS